MGVVSRHVSARARAGLLFAALGAQVLGAPAFAAPSVYVADAMKKIRPSDPPLGANEAHLFAAKNEFESFQAVVTGPATGVSAQMSALTGPSTLGTATLYREALMNLANPSSLDGATGRFPDALVPDVDDVVGEKRNAFPFDAPSGESRAIWVEFFVPANAPAGEYRGMLTVRSDQGQSQIPVTLTVWDFGLPSTASLRSHFGLSYPTLPQGHGVSGAEFTRLRGRYSQLGLDHRISLGSFDDGDFSIGHVESAYGTYIDGRAPTRLKGAKLTTVALVGKSLADWVARFKARGWFDRLFQYTCDEPPSSCAWSDIRTLNALNKAVDPALRTMVTTSIQQAKENGVGSSIDIYAPVINFLWDKPGQVFAGNQVSAYAAFLAQSPIHELWVYQSCMSHGCGGTSDYYTGWPSYMIDAPSPRARAQEWLTFQLGATGELYWETTWAYDHDPWTNQWDFTGNGDGTLFYPGTPAKIGGSTHIPVASIRLKMIREGMEDYEYLKRVSALGDPGFARRVASSLFPNPYTTAVAPADLSAARAKLAQRILELSAGSAQPPPPSAACSDGTEVEACSAQKPLLCRGGALVDRCDTCGCPAPWSCRSDGTCAEPAASASVYTAPALGAAPAVDGAFSEYEAAPAIQVGGARVKAAWDAQALYLAFDVPDAWLAPASAGGEDGLWDGDGVEVMLSSPTSPRGASAGASDFHFIVGVDGRLSDARVWTDFGLASGASASVDLKGASLGLGIASGYRVELRLPWAGLGIAPSEGLALGFDVAVNQKASASGGTTSVDWRGLSSFNNPAGWGSLVLGSASADQGAADAGQPSAVDAGAGTDAGGMAPDAGAPESLSDGGGTSQQDAGDSTGLDASEWLPLRGCSSAGGSVLGAPLLLLGWLLPRKAWLRRRSKPAEANKKSAMLEAIRRHPEQLSKSSE
jgi:hypothetical protein